MKKVFLMATIGIFTLVSCNQKTKEVTTTESEMMENDSTMMTNDGTKMENDSTMMNDGSSKKMMAEKMYACPMHPEVQGKLNDKCSKCGMKLTEPVAENAAE
ncbi:heavy metal-binding domain-containing protein [Flavobacterium sp.]|uniref:heavy metal-binding domain-containing protein n=1 Tax=Flavobacterium sp. TaxID=239 RepID=UPI00286A793E|nr:heavy metal-binding domain-containing protein [Flavobacterium sp.]